MSVLNGLALSFLLAQASHAAENMAVQPAPERPASESAGQSNTPPAQPQRSPDAKEAEPDPNGIPDQEETEIKESEYKQPNRWSLTAGGSQRKDWLTGRNRWTLNEEFSAKKLLGMPDWLNGTLEHRTRYETYDVAWRRDQAGGEHQIPMQTVLWLEANHAGFRAGFEFWDARQFGAKEGYTVNNSMVNVANFTQFYAAWSTLNLLDSGLGFEIKGGRQTLDIGGRRLVARNGFRNTVSSFTGLSARLRDGEDGWEVQTFVTQPVLRLPDERSKLLNNDWAWNEEQSDTLFAGVFAKSNALPWKIRGELYLFYLNENPSSDFSNGNPNQAGSRRLFTPGFRLYWPARKGRLDFEIESVAQAGKSRETALARELDHQAAFEHLQLGYTFDVPWEPRLILLYDYATGGEGGSTSRSFDTLYGARRGDLGPTGIFGPFTRNNINAPGTRLALSPDPDFITFLAYRAWWMADSKAMWQAARLIDPTGQSGDFLGHTVEISARWDPRINLSFEAGWNYLLKGNFARNAPGAPSNHDNVNYFYVQTMIRF